MMIEQFKMTPSELHPQTRTASGVERESDHQEIPGQPQGQHYQILQGVPLRQHKNSTVMPRVSCVATGHVIAESSALMDRIRTPDRGLLKDSRPRPMPVHGTISVGMATISRQRLRIGPRQAVPGMHAGRGTCPEPRILLLYPSVRGRLRQCTAMASITGWDRLEVLRKARHATGRSHMRQEHTGTLGAVLQNRAPKQRPTELFVSQRSVEEVSSIVGYIHPDHLCLILISFSVRAYDYHFAYR
jgi:hypothetical protein